MSSSSKFKVGERVLITSAPAGKKFHGKAATVLDVDYGYAVPFITVKVDGEGITRGWHETAFSKLTKLDKLLIL